MSIVDSGYEITDYELERNKPMPSFNHAILQGNINFHLNLHYRNKFRFLPELHIQLLEKPDAVPDISIYPILDVDFLHDIPVMTEKPMTVIEIMSPSQSNDDMLSRFERYFNAGIKSCWLVMPSLKAVVVYSNLDSYVFYSADMLLKDEILGIELTLSEIFK